MSLFSTQPTKGIEQFCDRNRVSYSFYKDKFFPGSGAVAHSRARPRLHPGTAPLRPSATVASAQLSAFCASALGRALLLSMAPRQASCGRDAAGYRAVRGYHAVGDTVPWGYHAVRELTVLWGYRAVGDTPICFGSRAVYADPEKVNRLLMK